MEKVRDFLGLPFKVAGALMRIMGRITIGVTGFVLMGAGLLLINPIHVWYIGLPVFLIGLLLLVKAIF